MEESKQAIRVWMASARNGYYAVDQYRPAQGSGTYGDALIFKRKGDAEGTAAALNLAYAAGMADRACLVCGTTMPGECPRCA